MPPQYSVSPNPTVSFQTTYEDEHLLVLNKPSGLVTQPGAKHQHDTLLNGAFSVWGKRLQNLGKKRDYGLLHRLDRGTSGLVMIALSAEAYDGLRAQFEAREIQKLYWTIISGAPRNRSGRCDVDIAEQRINGKKRAVLVPPRFKKVQTSPRISSSRGQRSALRHRNSSLSPATGPRAQKAITDYRVLHSRRGPHGLTSLVECQLLTGRLHQIRAHMRGMNTPVLGDFEYGGKSALNLLVKGIKRDHLALHAGSLCFTHPIDQRIMTVNADFPAWWTAMGEVLNLAIDSELIQRNTGFATESGLP